VNYWANIFPETCDKVAADFRAKIFRNNGVNIRVRILVDTNMVIARNRWNNFL
jgi:F420-0:gamma-glutamyl ligase-like protein